MQAYILKQHGEIACLLHTYRVGKGGGPPPHTGRLALSATRVSYVKGHYAMLD